MIKDKSPRIYAIILNWNGLKDTIECLESIEKVDYPNYGVVVADNGSTDGSLSALRKLFPNVEYLDNGSNLGFAGGNNRAIDYVLSKDVDYILLLNNDTVVHPYILTALVNGSVVHSKGGIFGPKMYYYERKNTIWCAGGYWQESALRFEEYGYGEEDQGQYDYLRRVDWIVGCAMFIPAKVIAEVGLLDADYFLNNEEIDYCSRIKNAGYDCVYVPEAKLWHKVSVSFGGEHSPLKEYFTSRNRLLWAQKNADRLLRYQVYYDSLKGVAKRVGFPYLHLLQMKRLSMRKRWWRFLGEKRDPVRRAYLLGWKDFWLGRFGDCPPSVRELTTQWVQTRSKT